METKHMKIVAPKPDSLTWGRFLCEWPFGHNDVVSHRRCKMQITVCVDQVCLLGKHRIAVLYGIIAIQYELGGIQPTQIQLDRNGHLHAKRALLGIDGV